ncbi:MAG: alkaline phosphatase family protein [Paludibaculum sp.]
MVSLDGLGYQALTTDPVARELTVLHDSILSGASAAGMQAAFPSTTANSHAALWTGCYGDVNHITANNPPLLPRASRTILERGNGFLATQLDSEAIWVTAAREGRSAVAHQPTQGYPFTPMNSGHGAIVLNGYQTRLLAPHALFTARNTDVQPDGSIHIKHGPLSLRAERRNGALRISLPGSKEFVDVRPAAVETELPRQRPLARYFSPGLTVSQPVSAVLYFRLFELTPNSFRLYVSPLQELAMTEPLPALYRQARRLYRQWS